MNRMTSLSGSIQYLYFCACLFSLSILFLRSIHVVRHVSELQSFSWLNSIPSAIFPLPVDWIIPATRLVPVFWWRWMMRLWALAYKHLFKYLLFYSHGCLQYPQVVLLDYMVILCLTFWRATSCTFLHSHQQSQSFLFLHILTNTYYFVL